MTQLVQDQTPRYCLLCNLCNVKNIVEQRQVARYPSSKRHRSFLAFIHSGQMRGYAESFLDLILPKRSGADAALDL